MNIHRLDNSEGKNVSVCKHMKIKNYDWFGIEVKDSIIHGNGLFATKVISKGKFIMEYTGKVFPHSKIIERRKVSDKIVKMTGHIIDGMKRGSNARYINHFVQPNAEFIKVIVYGTDVLEDGNRVQRRYTTGSFTWAELAPRAQFGVTIGYEF